MRSLPPRFRRAATPFGVAAVAALASGCEEVDQVRDRFRDLTPHEAYAASLADAGLTGTALAKEWVAASRTSVSRAAPVSLPFEEAGYITAEEPGAMAYRVTVPRGKKLTATVGLESEEGARVFVDLFRAPSDDADPPRPVISTDSVPGVFEHEPWRGGEFILRLQPELLRGGQYRIRLELAAQLAFPVEGHDMRAALSLYGAPRDGGRRSHAGIDIFARRGTPVVATSDGIVRDVDVTNLGGKVVWVRDPVRRSSIYFAHLDSQHVAVGQRVQRGDTVGFVGNTGNARTTPPHLHFGVYRSGEGAIDPAPFLREPGGSLVELTADLGRLGGWVRMVNGGVRLRAAPGPRTDVVRELDRHTPLRVLGGSRDFFRVRLPDGSGGYVAARLTEAVDQPVAVRTVAARQPVRSRPSEGAPAVAEVAGGIEVPVLGRFDGYLYVQSPDGRSGWVEDVRVAEDEEQGQVEG